MDEEISVREVHVLHSRNDILKVSRIQITYAVIQKWMKGRWKFRKALGLLKFTLECSWFEHVE